MASPFVNIMIEIAKRNFENREILENMSDATYHEWETAFSEAGYIDKLKENCNQINSCLDQLRNL